MQPVWRIAGLQLLKTHLCPCCLGQHPAQCLVYNSAFSSQGPLLVIFFFLIATLLRCNSHTIQFTLLECMIQWCFVYSMLCSHHHSQYIILKLHTLNFFLFYWSIVDLQCCVDFCCTAKWLPYTFIYILFHLLFRYGLSQDIAYCSLCHTVRPCCLSSL